MCKPKRKSRNRFFECIIESVPSMSSTGIGEIGVLELFQKTNSGDEGEKDGENEEPWKQRMRFQRFSDVEIMIVQILGKLELFQ